MIYKILLSLLFQMKMKKQNFEKILIKIFMGLKLNRNHSKISSQALINSELAEAYGHGLSRLKIYCERIQNKLINPKPKIKIKKFLALYLLLMLITV